MIALRSHLFIGAILATSIAAPASAQQKPSPHNAALPPTAVVRVPTTFGAAQRATSDDARPVPGGEYPSEIRTQGDRASVLARVTAERYAAAMAAIKLRGAGKIIPLKKARY